jgi:hypothetical protein
MIYIDFKVMLELNVLCTDITFKQGGSKRYRT